MIAGHSVLTFCGVSVLYKLRVNPAQFTTSHYTTPIRVAPTHATPIHATPFLPELVGILLFVAGEVAIFSGGGALFAYGTSRLRASHAQERGTRQPSRSVALNHSTSSGSGGYGSHIAAVCSLTVGAVIRAPIFYDSVTCYRQTGGTALLVSACADCIMLVLWVTAWLGLTLKRHWSIREFSTKDAEHPEVKLGNGNANRIVKFDASSKTIYSGPPLSPSQTTPLSQNYAPATVSSRSVRRPASSIDHGMEGGEGLFRLHVDATPINHALPRPLATPIPQATPISRPEDTVTRRYRNDLRSCCDNYYYQHPSRGVARGGVRGGANAFSTPRSASSADVYTTRGIDGRGFEGRDYGGRSFDAGRNFGARPDFDEIDRDTSSRRPLSTGYLQSPSRFISPVYERPGRGVWSGARSGTVEEEDQDDQDDDAESWPLDAGSLDSNDVLCSRV